MTIKGGFDIAPAGAAATESAAKSVTRGVKLFTRDLLRSLSEQSPEAVLRYGRTAYRWR
jgi:hypothetical protein